MALDEVGHCDDPGCVCAKHKSVHQWVSAKHLGYEDEVWCVLCGAFAYSPTEGDRESRCELQGGLSETLGGTL